MKYRIVKDGDGRYYAQRNKRAFLGLFPYAWRNVYQRDCSLPSATQAIKDDREDRAKELRRTTCEIVWKE